MAALEGAVALVNLSVDQTVPVLLRAAISKGCAYLHIGADARAIARMLEWCRQGGRRAAAVIR
jgi:hypothetical protein